MTTENFLNNQFFDNSNEIDRINESFAYDNLYDYLKPVSASAFAGCHSTPSDSSL